jgi:hypothetical protein
LSGAAAKLPPRTRCLHDTHPSAFFDTTLPYDQLMDRMSKHFRRNLRGHQNKLQAAGELRLATFSSAAGAGPGSADDREGANDPGVAAYPSAAADPAARPGGADGPGPDGLTAAFDDFLAIEASGWKGQTGAGSAIGLRPHLVAFYRALMATMTAPDDHCVINALHLDGRCIAAQFCVRAGAEYTILKIAYDEEFARLGPGQLLFQKTLERCCADPDIAYIDLINDAPWMRDWHTELMPMEQAHVALSPVWGPVVMAALQFRHGPARRLVQKYRASRAHRDKPTTGRRAAAQPPAQASAQTPAQPPAGTPDPTGTVDGPPA